MTVGSAISDPSQTQPTHLPKGDTVDLAFDLDPGIFCVQQFASGDDKVVENHVVDLMLSIQRFEILTVALEGVVRDQHATHPPP